ncbi:hypothetical protein TRFO_16881 [Tritrichomonas foetus]|uniref:Uncharacterized protein n=1 Tax=Tritrichomonas foetus TaxID=1144522 RepID=A0A1J4KQD1_9EUKA|nr:hypothetical protein TRFO_16881 [Tritrichomonas foetus]|eukprot:OHT13120.1 hypothetical protein TRFO_16881 [Tritrichomonas foetus]
MALSLKQQETVPNLTRHLNRLIYRLENREEDLERQTANERLKIGERLKDYDYEKSEAWRAIKSLGWDSLNQKELLSVAYVISNKCGAVIDREAKRRKAILVKWFDENLEAIQPYFKSIKLEYGS